MSASYKAHRERGLASVKKFIKESTIIELALIIEEIRFCHDNLTVYHKRTNSMYHVSTVECMHHTIQLNIED